MLEYIRFRSSQICKTFRVIFKHFAILVRHFLLYRQVLISSLLKGLPYKHRYDQLYCFSYCCRSKQVDQLCFLELQSSHHGGQCV